MSLTLCIVWMWVYALVSFQSVQKKASLNMLSKALIYAHGRTPLGVNLLLHSINRRIAFGFILGPCPILSKVLGNSSNTEYGFHLIPTLIHLLNM